VNRSGWMVVCVAALLCSCRRRRVIT
jgi:hypothetical protein